VVVPDRQLSLAIGKEGQNTRLAARLTGWRLDIKGMSEWEEIKEATQALNGSAEEPEVEAAKAVEEASTIVEETAVAVEPEPMAEETTAAVEPEPMAEETTAAVEPEPMAEETAIPEPIEAVVSEPEVTLEEIDEDAILAALIQEEEEQEQEQEAVVESLSVEDLGSFTIDDVELSNEDEDDEEDDRDEDLPSFDGLPVLIPDAGKIRFAEDIVEEYRGGSRSGRRRRGGGGGGAGGARGGGARGGGSRGGGAAAGGGR
jgi:N utilization substance protein A